MKKSNKKGFTLVELVVGIAIIGILAAILVPTMMNYVKKAKLKSANSNAKLVFTTISGQLSDLVVDGNVLGSNGSMSVASVNVSDLSNGGSTAEDILKNSVFEALKDNGKKAGKVAFTIESNEVKWTQWASNGSTGDLIGQYPDPDSDYKTNETRTFGTKFN